MNLNQPKCLFKGIHQEIKFITRMKTKKRISKNESIKQIVELLRQGYATEEILEEISSNWVLPETTFYNHFKEAKKTYNNELQEQKRELEAIRLTEVKKAAQKGLKSKFERDVEIQDEIEHYKSVLSGEKKVSFILGQKVSATENLPIQLVLLVQNTINDLRKELAKRLGEYEATTIRVEEVKPDVTYITLAELDEMERRLNGGGNTT